VTGVADVPVEHHTDLVNGVRLHYVTAGEGVPVVLLHGWPQTWYEWRRIIPALAARYSVVAPDLRGLGDSSRPATGYDKRTVAEDVYLLLQKLDLGRVFLVGHDWGGPVAYALAAAHPERVRRLVLLDTMIPLAESAGSVASVPGVLPLWHIAFHGVRDLPEALVTGRERIYLSWFFRELAYDPSAITSEDVEEYVRCYSAPGALRAGFEYYRAADQDAVHNRENAHTKLKMPVLALGGRRGGFGPLVKISAESVAEDVRGEALDRCGHWIPEERPEILVNQLLRFFGEESD
jgi:pimeloyl-ACP methyl ester carboxylesterase